MINIISLTKTSTAAPAQWEGATDDNRLVYIRERHGSLTILISSVGATDIGDAVRGEMIFESDAPEGLIFDELMDLTKDTIHFSEEVIHQQTDVSINEFYGFMFGLAYYRLYELTHNKPDFLDYLNWRDEIDDQYIKVYPDQNERLKAISKKIHGLEQGEK